MAKTIEIEQRINAELKDIFEGWTQACAEAPKEIGCEAPAPYVVLFKMMYHCMDKEFPALLPTYLKNAQKIYAKTTSAENRSAGPN